MIGGACALCPWGAMADVVREAMKPYGWDIQLCHNCAGGARAARHVAAGLIPEPRPVADGHMPTPTGPVDFGVTGTHYLQWAYLGIDVFASLPEAPLMKKFRLVANIQEPTCLIIAVKRTNASDARISAITDLAEITQKRLPVKERYLERRNLPYGYFRGVDRPTPSLGRTGISIYGRDDMPDEFAYTLARAMDEHQDLLQWTNMNFSYNPHTVWKAFDVPLHLGAAR